MKVVLTRNQNISLAIIAAVQKENYKKSTFNLIYHINKIGEKLVYLLRAF